MQKQNSEPPPAKPTWVKFIPNQRLAQRLAQLDGARSTLQSAVNRLKSANDNLETKVKK